MNVCGANHFSSTNTRVGKHYSNGGKYDNLILKKESVKRSSNSHSKDTSGAGLQSRHAVKGTFGGAKRLTTKDRNEKYKRNHPRIAPRSGGGTENGGSQPGNTMLQ